jgi:transposase-like protein
MVNFRKIRFSIAVILAGIRWWVTCPLNYQRLQKMMTKRGLSVDQSTIKQWTIRFLPLIVVHRKGKFLHMEAKYRKLIFLYLCNSTCKENDDFNTCL